jgi:hypothetical protein
MMITPTTNFVVVVVGILGIRTYDILYRIARILWVVYLLL